MTMAKVSMITNAAPMLLSMVDIIATTTTSDTDTSRAA